MNKPSLGASLDRFERACRFSIYAVLANPATRDKASLLTGSLAAVKALRGEIAAADDAVLEKRAILGYWDARLDPTIKAVASAARFADSLDARLRIADLFFAAKSASQMVRPTGVGFDRELADARSLRKVFDLVPEAAPTEALRGLLPQLDTCLEGGAAAHADLVAALGTRKLAVRKSVGVKRAVREALDRLEGQLLDLFPGQRDVVRAFFLPTDEAAAPEETPEETPAETSVPA